jgi:hypothetical protein
MYKRVVVESLVAAAVGVVAGVLPAAPALARAPVTVQGTVAGSYTSVPTNPDTGHGYRVTAHGHTSLGATTAKGRVQGPGNVSSGRCTARLTLSTAKGTLVVVATGQHTVKGFASCQSGFGFNWHVAKGTGDYDGASSSGTGTLTLVERGHSSQSPPPAYVTFDPAG